MEFSPLNQYNFSSLRKLAADESCTRSASENYCLSAQIKMNKTGAKWPCMTNGVSSINENNVEIDRISSLHDDVLTHILSFLSTKEAVQTCILSKRWKNTWATVPVLDIKHNDFLVSGDHDCNGDYNKALRISAARLKRFMTGFLDNRAPTNLDRVCCVSRNFEVDASIGWLDCVAFLRPLLMDIFISNSNLIDMPDSVFSCSNMHHLSMTVYTGINNTIIRPVSINLPSLKFLELTWLKLHDDFAQKLFMGCPSLERLKLHHCDLYFSGICSEVLKELTLDCCYIWEQMQISCPALISLDMLINLEGVGISLKNMSSVVDVVIKLYGYVSDDVPVLNLFGGLSNVTNLELQLTNNVFKDQLEKDIRNVRNFNNLRNLAMEGTWDMSCDFYLIACLLKHSPNLKELNLLLNESRGQIQEPQEEVSGAVLFQYEYLETVKMGRNYGVKLSSKMANAKIKTLGTYVKKIGNVIIN